MKRAGFTLLEVMVAIVLTSVVALAAFGAAQASAASRARLEGGLRAAQTERVVRQMLLELLHNARVARPRRDTPFRLAGDTLSFVAAGAPPLDPEYDWRVNLYGGDSGLTLVAQAIGPGPPRTFALTVPGATLEGIEVLPQGAAEWRREWPASGVLPRAVTIRMHGADWPRGDPFLVTLSQSVPRALPENGDGES